MMNVEITVPEKFLGDITGNVSSKRGQIEGVDDRGMAKVVRCIIPLSEMFGYMSTLRSMTEGRASFNMEFSRYDIVPQNVADEVIKSRK
jgi:elongation factor G